MQIYREFLVVLFFLLSGSCLAVQQEEVLLTTAMLEDGEQEDQGTELLGRGNDFFLRRAAFDFGAVWFRLRGLGQEEQKLYLNGLSLNNTYNGRPDWNRLGGLTDIGRNPGQALGLAFNPYGFGGLGELRSLDARPNRLREGTRLTLSSSNRNYRWRQMITYNSGLRPNGLNFLLSISHRHAASGYVQGTPYRSLAAYGMLQWVPGKGHEIGLFGLLASIERGTRPALTEEIFSIAGERYNPQWGWDKGEMRNARLRSENLPLIGLQHNYRGKRIRTHITLGYIGGLESRDRLAYFGASNPDPAYYRNLPSFYLNSPLGPNYWNASQASGVLASRPKIDWARLRQANQLAGEDQEARYAVLADLTRTRRWRGRSVIHYNPSTFWELNTFFEIDRSQLDFGQNAKDLLGARFFHDWDPFSRTANDLEGKALKLAGDRVGYSFHLTHQNWNLALQAKRSLKRFEVALGILYGHRSYRREGLFKSERYPERSLGTSATQRYHSHGLKLELGYRISGRYWVFGQLVHRSLPPEIHQAFLDPRQHDVPFPVTDPMVHSGGSLNWYLRHPKLKGRISGYYFQAQGIRDLRSFYTETAVGSAFVREASWGQDSSHLGLESGLEIALNPEFNLGVALSVGSWRYISNPRVQLFTWPNPEATDPLPKAGFLDLGEAVLKGRRLPNSPEIAGTLSLSYRSPEYWWMDLRLNYLGPRPLIPALIRQTDTFVSESHPAMEHLPIPPGAEVSAKQPDVLEALYLLNLSLGKSWRVRGKYISAFLGLNNLFNRSYRSGGYQQGRLASLPLYAEDNRRGRPSFGPRFWNGFGRTYFLNLSLNL